MADRSNAKFWRALKEFIRDAKESNPDPITTDIVVTYDPETGEITAKRVGGITTQDDPGGTGGGTSYP